MRILCVFGEHNYGDPSRGAGYEYSNFVPALKNLGHEIAFFDSFSRTLYRDFSDLNRSLLQKVEAFEPDVVFCVLMGYEVWLETLELIHETGACLINWGTDDSWKYEQFSRYLAPAFDLWVTTSHHAYEKAVRDGLGNFVLSQWGARADAMQAPLVASECRYPVSFVGSAYGNRPRWIAGLRAAGIDVACFGHGWPAGAVPAERIPEIVRGSVISLNFADSGLHFQGLRPYRSRQIKARTFEVPGAGGCLLTESADQLETYYVPGVEIGVFGNLDDLTDKIRQLLDAPERRDAMAKLGYLRTSGEHTYEKRFSGVLARLPQRETHGKVDWGRFERLAAAHAPTASVRFLCTMLTKPFRWIWGGRRGLRAARRLCFECAWRFCGRDTYTSAGWPGRLFYRES